MLIRIRRYLSASLVPITLSCLFLFGLSSTRQHIERGDLPNFLLSIAFALIIITALIVLPILNIYANGQIWSQAASKNSLDWYEPKNFRADSTLSPVLVQGATGWEFEELYINRSSGLTVGLLEITYGNSEMFSFKTRYAVATTAINSRLPHLFINGIRHKKFSQSTEMWALNSKLKTDTKIIDLEGDFSKYFSIYSSNRNELNALTIVTPDVMLELQEKGYEFDYEVYNGKLTIIRDANLQTVADLDSMLDGMQACTKELVHQLENHTFENTEATLPMKQHVVVAKGYWYGARMTVVLIALGLALLSLGVLAGQLLSHLQIQL